MSSLVIRVGAACSADYPWLLAVQPARATTAGSVAKAMREPGRNFIPATIAKMTNDKVRLLEMSENLHRADLSKLERDDNITEWIKITERRSLQHATKGLLHRPEGVHRAVLSVFKPPVS